MSTTETGGNFVKVNRLKYGWTCNVSVTADDNTTEALQDAKVKALAIIRELNEDLNPVIVQEVTEEEVPF